MEKFESKNPEITEIPQKLPEIPTIDEKLEQDIDDILEERSPHMDNPDRPLVFSERPAGIDEEALLEADIDAILEGESSGIDVSGVDAIEEASGDDIFAEEESYDKHTDNVTNEVEQEPYKTGGSYKDVKEHSSGETHEVHHMPSDDASNLERNDGPCIKMEKEDHRETASYGNSREARAYRAKQRELIEQGKFKEAQQMDIDDIREKFGNKYDEAIKQMEEYTKKLEEEGKI
ncbi:MAG: hypothetical protein Q4A54_02285 [Parabacteroides sp.]|nr:hypothetical protein [Parabacteroides sp.]